MRALIYFPIIHSPQDLGSLSQVASNIRTNEQQNTYLDPVQQFWEMIGSTIEGLRLDYKTIKIYQDGLPVCGEIKEIVAEVAESGSLNHRLLQTLNQKGGMLIGTESPELLAREYALMTQMLSAVDSTETCSEDAKTLLDLRDEYIAQRIDETLQNNEMGILFLGLMHNIEKKLPKDIVVIQPLGKPNIIKGCNS